MPVNRLSTRPPTAHRPHTTNDAPATRAPAAANSALHADTFVTDSVSFVGDVLGFAGRTALSAVGLGSAPEARRSRTVDEFISHAKSQLGTPYLLGGKADVSNDDPARIDCSGLVRWAARRAGGSIPDGSWNQMRAMHKMDVSDAIDTRGALLYKPGHIAISLGNGLALEAQPGVGVVTLPAVGRGWTQGGKVPGLRYED